jgi:hypothetical protein
LVVGCGKNNAVPPQHNDQEPPAVIDPDEVTIDPAEDPAGEPGTSSEEPIDENDLTPTPQVKQQKYPVVLYFPDSDLMRTYRVKTEVAVKDKKQLPKAALEAWLAGPQHKELTGLVHDDVVIEYVQDVGGVAHVSFSKEIQDIKIGLDGELLFAEQVAMIMQQFGYEQTQLLVEGKVVETLFEYFYTKDPISAKDPDSYRWVEEMDPREIVLQNTAFRIYEPAPGAVVKDKVVIRGMAQVFEAAFQYEFKVGDKIVSEGYTMASEGAPGWGEFEIVIELGNVTGNTGTVVIYETSMKDGSRLNELAIPVTIAK